MINEQRFALLANYFLVQGANTQDAMDLYDYVKSTHPNDKNIIVVSHSLGTGVTSKVGQAKAPACVLLGMPFGSMLQTTYEVSGYASLYWFYLIDWWRSLSYIGRYDEDVPLMILSADQDELIPPHHQHEMFEESNAKEKWLISCNCGHNSIGQAVEENGEVYDEFFGKCLART